LIAHQEPFPLGCGDKPDVETDELQRRGPAFGGKTGGGELEGIGDSWRQVQW
jgi:hypothetical protein